MSLPLVCLVLALNHAAAPIAGCAEWAIFLKNPSAEALRRLELALDSCRPPACEPSPSSDDVRHLSKLVRSGQEYAVQAAFMIRSHLDGGDLEDITRSLGELADLKPHLFLAEVKRRGMSTRELRAIVRMLPESVVDDADARRAAVSARVKSLTSVADENLRSVRDTSISLLTGEGAR